MVQRATFLFFLANSIFSIAVAGALPQDTIRLLEEVQVSAYAHGRPLAEIPAAVSVIGKPDVNRFSNTSFLPLLNTQPGIRMEERSPGSYRLSIRGSSLRSPFGVRNVKVYWNGIPFTDPGGNTYLNLIDFSGIDRMEVIRGPGSSLYGAGTGGVVLLETRHRPERIRAEVSAGGYGMFRASGGYHAGDDKRSIDIRLARQSAEGYRRQSAMEREVIQVTGHLATGKKTTLSLAGFSSALNYQTPGGLTIAQYKLDPSQARPSAGPNPGAVEQQAAVSNVTTFAGVSAERRHNEQWSSTLVAYGNATNFSNPAIRNYEQRTERSAGFRWNSKYTFTRGQLAFGAEGQWGGTDISVHQNLSGKRGTLQSRAAAPAATGMLFIQADKEFSNGWFFTGGISVNRYRVKFSQTVPVAFSDVQKPSLTVIPRLAVSKKFSDAVIVYASAGQGFSPPTVAEVFPSVAVYNKALRAERGTNLESGVRGTAGPVQYSLTGFRLLTGNTIVIRRDESGADYFINAGETLQKGMEVMVAIQDYRRRDRLKDLRGWMSYTRADHRFVDYVKGTDDFSGNRLTGTPRDMASAGVELLKGAGLQASLTANFCSALPLNDANTSIAPEYYTFAARIGYRSNSMRYPMEFFAGGENLLDRRYSLGNDLNAVGGRYYNAAPGRMVYAGISVRRMR